MDEAEEDRGQSKDDEDGLEVEDEDEDLRAGTKNQHGISYANSKEDSEDEWDGIWRPEPTGGMSDEDTSQCLNSASPLLPLVHSCSNIAGVS